MKPYFIIDFDSTFVTVETLEHLAALAFDGKKDKDILIAKISHIAKQGMEGSIPYHQSLSSRLKLIQANKTHVKIFTEELKKRISPSIARNREFFHRNQQQIYIVSGGFFDYIYPVVKDFDVQKSHVLANYFMYDQNGKIIGYDEHIPLCRQGGKAESVRSLGLCGKIYVIGDGYTDYEIKKAGLAHHFIVFMENVKRKSIVNLADHTVENFDEFVSMLQHLS